MMMSNGILRNVPESMSTEKTETKIKDEDTTQTCENNVSISKDEMSDSFGLVSMLTALMSMLMTNDSKSYGDIDMKSKYELLDNKYHELDKKIAVLDAIINHK